MPSDDINIRLSIVCPGGGSIVFGPLTRSEHSVIDGGITVVDEDGAVETLDHRSGIEALALAHLRDDLRRLAEAGHGIVYFGDHDFGQIVELEVTHPGVIRVLANLASLDRFDIPIGELPIEGLQAFIDQIDHIDSELGPLDGYCEGCGRPTSAYYPKPLPT